jgi:hypothetical protein
MQSYPTSKSTPPGVARQLVTFLVLPRKVTKRNRPRFAAASRYPALLDWSGGCGTRTTCSDSPRRNPLTSLRYSAAHRGKKSGRCGVRCAHGFLFCRQRSARYAGFQRTILFRTTDRCVPKLTFKRGLINVVFNLFPRIMAISPPN